MEKRPTYGEEKRSVSINLHMLYGETKINRKTWRPSCIHAHTLTGMQTHTRMHNAGIHVRSTTLAQRYSFRETDKQSPLLPAGNVEFY